MQKIQYAKGKSHFVAKLDGTFKIPTAAGAAAVEQTELQQSIFNAPVPGAAPVSTPAAATKAPTSGDQTMTDVSDAGNRGQKRTRDSDEESDEDVAMEEDSDDD